jgi:NADH-ubiquinone oxidoreductase subunit G-like iron-sulfur protein
MDHPLPYDDVIALRDRMWELSPSIVEHDTLVHTSTDIALAGLKTLAVHTASATVSGAPFLKPIANFYQTDPISRAYVWPSSLYRFRISLWVMPGLQIGDNGTIYTRVCQGRAIRALRVGEVGTGCVCMTGKVQSSLPVFDRWNLKHYKKSFSNSLCRHPLP